VYLIFIYNVSRKKCPVTITVTLLRSSGGGTSTSVLTTVDKMAGQAVTVITQLA